MCGGWCISWGRGSSPGGGTCLQMEREGGCSVCPTPSVHAKGVEDMQAGWGATQVEGTAACEQKGGGGTLSLLHPWHACRAGGVGQGGGPHKWEEGVHYPLCILVCAKRVRAWKQGACDKRGMQRGWPCRWGGLCKGGE